MALRFFEQSVLRRSRHMRTRSTSRQRDRRRLHPQGVAKRRPAWSTPSSGPTLTHPVLDYDKTAFLKNPVYSRDYSAGQEPGALIFPSFDVARRVLEDTIGQRCSFGIIQGLNSLSLVACCSCCPQAFSLIFGLMRDWPSDSRRLLHARYLSRTTALRAWAGPRSLGGGARGPASSFAAIGGLFERLVLTRLRRQPARTGAGDAGMSFIISDACLMTWGGDSIRCRRRGVCRRRRASSAWCFRPIGWCWSDARSSRPSRCIFFWSGPVWAP